jgi:hypothetical protein
MKRRLRLLVFFVALEAVTTLVARLRGYPLGGDVVVRCRRGHFFTTLWIPGVSVKSLRLGWWRAQWCPVGRHLTIVSPVRPADLSWRQRRAADAHRDVRLP